MIEQPTIQPGDGVHVRQDSETRAGERGLVFEVFDDGVGLDFWPKGRGVEFWGWDELELAQ